MVSVFDLFKIGIGPSSSHTVGPMRASAEIAERLARHERIADLVRLEVRLFGSLAFTGKGHGTGEAIVLGLAGERPETVDPDAVATIVATARETGRLRLAGRRDIAFRPESDIVHDFTGEAPHHPNTMAFTALDAGNRVLFHERWCSVGGGFIVPEEEVERPPAETGANVPFRFRSGRLLLAISAREAMSIAGIVRANEEALRPADEIEIHLSRVLDTMMGCIDRGLANGGELPGGLRVKRRAKALAEKLQADASRNDRDPHEVMDWVSLYAIAVNEENAAGGRVVTAPTNGAAGIIPAVLRYYRDHCRGASRAGMETFLLTATAIGGLFKENASISGADVGCQGEVGVACSMAAAGLCAALGGSPEQIENAAEIGMEHHLGLTCDPIAGLVQVPCIERNAFGAVAAVQAASLALRGDGTHIVSLDKVIVTMRETGRDMASKYKETSLGGLAVNHPEC